MKFKGLNFRKSNNVVALPNMNFDVDPPVPFRHAVESNYVYFGRVLKDQSKADPKVHIKTHYCAKGDPDKKALYAEVIPGMGHSLTNMMYGEDNRVYLMVDGVCYTATRPA